MTHKQKVVAFDSLDESVLKMVYRKGNRLIGRTKQKSGFSHASYLLWK